TEILGLGHALWIAREAIGADPFFCILGDTILKADYTSLLAAEENCIAVREVEDPRRFGVVRMDGDSIAEFVEKPEVPPSNLAIVGAYLIRDASALWNAMTDIIENNKRNKGEFQLTDGLQDMLAQGLKFSIAPIEDWYDCGKKETWIETNRALLETIDSGDYPQCSIASGVEIVDSKIGSFVSIASGAVIRNCELSNCVIGPNAKVVNSKLSDSLVGESASVDNYTGSVNIGDWCELEYGNEKGQI
ncbi:nucleotidyl transferase, partial [bacterium]|nr:nucleotidyl transferase [bacterium]